jgi:hypothetical protein
VFVSGVCYPALDDPEHAEEDIKTAFPYILEILTRPGLYLYCSGGTIGEEDLDESLALLELIAEREFSFETGLDEEAKKRKVEEWKQWWEKEGKHQKLDLSAVKERFEAYRSALR